MPEVVVTYRLDTSQAQSQLQILQQQTRELQAEMARSGAPATPNYSAATAGARDFAAAQSEVARGAQMAGAATSQLTAAQAGLAQQMLANGMSAKQINDYFGANVVAAKSSGEAFDQLATKLTTTQQGHDALGRSVQTTVNYLNDGTAKVNVAVTGYDALGQKATSTAQAHGTLEEALSKANTGAQNMAIGLKAADEAGASLGQQLRLGTQAASAFGATGLGPLPALLSGVSGGAATATAGVVALAVGAAVGTVALVSLGGQLTQSESQLAAWGNMSQAQAGLVGQAIAASAGQSIFSVNDQIQALKSVIPMLEQMGVSAGDVAGQQRILASANDLAAASGQGLQVSTLSLVETMRTFRETDPSQVANILLSTSQLTGTGLQQLSDALGRMHDRFGPLSPDLQSAAALLDGLAESGVRGQRGLQAVNTAAETLLGGSTAVRAELDAMGISITDAAGKTKSWDALYPELIGHLSAMSDAQRIATEDVLFGKAAAAALDDQIVQGLPHYEDLRQKALNSANAQTEAQEATKNLRDDLSKLGNAITADVIPPAIELATALDGVVRAADLVAEHIRDIPKPPDWLLGLLLSETPLGDVGNAIGVVAGLARQTQPGAASPSVTAAYASELHPGSLEAHLAGTGTAPGAVPNPLNPENLDPAALAKAQVDADKLEIEADRELAQGHGDTYRAMMAEVELLREGKVREATDFKTAVAAIKQADLDQAAQEAQLTGATHSAVMDRLNDKLIEASAEQQIAAAGGRLTNEQLTQIRNLSSEQQTADDQRLARVRTSQQLGIQGQIAALGTGPTSAVDAAALQAAATAALVPNDRLAAAIQQQLSLYDAQVRAADDRATRIAAAEQKLVDDQNRGSIYLIAGDQAVLDAYESGNVRLGDLLAQRDQILQAEYDRQTGIVDNVQSLVEKSLSAQAGGQPIAAQGSLLAASLQASGANPEVVKQAEANAQVAQNDVDRRRQIQDTYQGYLEKQIDAEGNNQQKLAAAYGLAASMIAAGQVDLANDAIRLGTIEQQEADRDIARQQAVAQAHATAVSSILSLNKDLAASQASYLAMLTTPGQPGVQVPFATPGDIAADTAGMSAAKDRAGTDLALVTALGQQLQQVQAEIGQTADPAAAKWLKENVLDPLTNTYTAAKGIYDADQQTFSTDQKKKADDLKSFQQQQAVGLAGVMPAIVASTDPAAGSTQMLAGQFVALVKSSDGLVPKIAQTSAEIRFVAQAYQDSIASGSAFGVSTEAWKAQLDQLTGSLDADRQSLISSSSEMDALSAAIGPAAAQAAVLADSLGVSTVDSFNTRLRDTVTLLSTTATTATTAADAIKNIFSQPTGKETALTAQGKVLEAQRSVLESQIAGASPGDQGVISAQQALDKAIPGSSAYYQAQGQLRAAQRFGSGQAGAVQQQIDSLNSQIDKLNAGVNVQSTGRAALTAQTAAEVPGQPSLAQYQSIFELAQGALGRPSPLGPVPGMGAPASLIAALQQTQPYAAGTTQPMPSLSIPEIVALAAQGGLPGAAALPSALGATLGPGQGLPSTAQLLAGVGPVQLPPVGQAVPPELDAQIARAAQNSDSTVTLLQGILAAANVMAAALAPGAGFTAPAGSLTAPSATGASGAGPAGASGAGATGGGLILPASWYAALNQHETPQGAGPWGPGFAPPSASNPVPMFGLGPGFGVPTSGPMASQGSSGPSFSGSLFTSFGQGVDTLNGWLQRNVPDYQQYVSSGNFSGLLSAMVQKGYAGPGEGPAFISQTAGGLANLTPEQIAPYAALTGGGTGSGLPNYYSPTASGQTLPSGAGNLVGPNGDLFVRSPGWSPGANMGSAIGNTGGTAGGAAGGDLANRQITMHTIVNVGGKTIREEYDQESLDNANLMVTLP